MDRLKNRVDKVLQSSGRDFNSLPFEERKKIHRYRQMEQIQTLYIVLNRYKEYISPGYRKKLVGWLDYLINVYDRGEQDGSN